MSLSPEETRYRIEYIREHKIHFLLEGLTAQLLESRPTNPVDFLIGELRKKQHTCPHISVAVFGLDNAGKSSLISAMGGEIERSPTATIGFNPVKFTTESCHLTVYDLGGGSRFRGVWPAYFADVHGVIFVVDSADHHRLSESKDALHEILSDHRIAGKPILVFANKQDVDGCLSPVAVEEALALTGSAEHHVFGSSATVEPIDEFIDRGVEWLLTKIRAKYPDLHHRVHWQTTEEKRREREVRALQQQRALEARAAREAEEKQQETAAQNG
eukprot:TRINITY_DN12650_c0_g1_i1.p1 TRINITY_DN12650_c0_g1~~TRINITY_DN12650_c0_g1_i1.p1  ORF type:complete len:272 (+),score=49.06 TRINITY_DN12650_c0_g1_i1:95-910(+)